MKGDKGKCTFRSLPPPGKITSTVGPPDLLSGRTLISVPSSSAFRVVLPGDGRSRPFLASQSQKSCISSGVSSCRLGLLFPLCSCTNASWTSCAFFGDGSFLHGESAFGSCGAGSCLNVWLSTARILGFGGGGGVGVGGSVGLGGKVSRIPATAAVTLPASC